MRNETLVEDRLDGSSNFSSWKSRLQITLEEDDLLSLTEKTPAETTYEMYDALKKMFESNTTNKALTLKHQLQNIKMTKADTIATFFMRISKMRDWLGSIGETITKRELIMTTLNALPRHWEPFLQSISGREDLPEFDRLWTDCTQEETRLIARGMQDSHHDDNQSLTSHANRGRRNRRSFGKEFKDKKTSTTPGHEHRKDISRIQCFRCDKYGHIPRNCPTMKKGRQHASIADVDSEPPQRDEDIKDKAFFFISTLSGMVPMDSDTWLIDSGASRHMNGYREHLTDLVEKESHLHVVLSDNSRYIVKGVETFTFQLDSGIPLQLSEVLYVSGMKMNLIFVSALEDKGYKVTFSKGKFLAWHKNSHMYFS
jgi:hypothetical protein